MLKKIILILVFVFPVAGIIVFNFYSKSHFEIPVYYQEGLPKDLSCDSLSYPYTINPDISFLRDDSISILPFQTSDLKIFSFAKKSNFYLSEINRVADEFHSIEAVKIYSFSLDQSDSRIPSSLNIQPISTVQSLMELQDCVFLFPEGEDNALLVDQQNRIRGYYDLMDGELTDSLIIETKILLHQIELTDED